MLEITKGPNLMIWKVVFRVQGNNTDDEDLIGVEPGTSVQEVLEKVYDSSVHVVTQEGLGKLSLLAGKKRAAAAKRPATSPKRGKP